MSKATELKEFERGETLTADRLNELRQAALVRPWATGSVSQGEIGNAYAIQLPRQQRGYYSLIGSLDVLVTNLVGTGATFDEYPSCLCQPLVFSMRTNTAVPMTLPRDSRIWFPRLPTWARWPAEPEKVCAWSDEETGRLLCDMDLPDKLFGLPQVDVATNETGELRVQYFDATADDWMDVIDPVTDLEVDIVARNPWTPTITSLVRATIIRLGTGEYIYDNADC